MTPESPPSASSLPEELAVVFAQDLHIDVPTPETDLLATGRLDSVAVVELLLLLEKRFGLCVDMEDLEIDNFRSLATIAALIAAHRHNGGP